MAWSLSPPVYDRFHGTQQHRDSFGRRQELESAFYRDLVCCNKRIHNLHHLLLHYEKHHHAQQPADDEVPTDQAMEIEEAVTTNVTHDDNSLAPIIPGVEDASDELLLFRSTSDVLFQTDYMAPDKPYKCTVPGCLKSYKNANGLKYHREHGHLNDENDDDRPFRCTIGTCHKRYKQLSGLKYHITHAHMAPAPAFSQLLSLQPDPFS
ncbi:hypothetical protein BJV82DRAFT_586400 [Fennellomyces sp. T-0311]|nr:hypothetical protein BJV82DRAFT_586400 [Fennellomyces sp. T-0311]